QLGQAIRGGFWALGVFGKGVGWLIPMVGTGLGGALDIAAKGFFALAGAADKVWGLLLQFFTAKAGAEVASTEVVLANQAVERASHVATAKVVQTTSLAKVRASVAAAQGSALAWTQSSTASVTAA